ncbi:hypothetical protein SH668x_002523 [Planctomicrobium sp. SH668]|uniref:hypothetical protein n=1 Tax=Planctomicrobium sp. SH668 TaxID=3448126 RepID=UPI003F5CB65D
MVREARFLWNSQEPLPSELTRRSWDCDDEEAHTDLEHPVRRRRDHSQATSNPFGAAGRKGSPVRR